MPNAFSQRLENLPPEIWSKITKIDELKGQWIAGARLNNPNNLKQSVKQSETIRNNQNVSV